MKIGVVATHSFPIPWKTHTGDVVILDLAAGLTRLGHQVTVYAPEGTVVTPGCELRHMPCSWGKYPPTAEECERKCFEDHATELRNHDLVHDFSVCKRVAWSLINEGKRNVVGTPLGGTWRHLGRPMNVTVWSEAMKQRGMRGASDYEGTSFEQWKDDRQPPISGARVVYGGIDTKLYDDPSNALKKENFLLWANRWHPAKGYKMAIDLARETGAEVVMAGEHPDNETYDYQRDCALGAVKYASGLGNVHFEFLPPDPDHHTKKREMYRRARALLYTVQFHEPFGLSQVEAMTSWTPVVGTRLGSVPEVVTDGVTGVVCDNDVKALAKAVDRIREISPLTCRTTAARRFSRETMAENYLKVYEDVLSGKGL